MTIMTLTRLRSARFKMTKMVTFPTSWETSSRMRHRDVSCNIHGAKDVLLVEKMTRNTRKEGNILPSVEQSKY